MNPIPPEHTVRSTQPGHHIQETRHTFRCSVSGLLCFLILLLICARASPSLAQDHPSDLTDLSLEEFLSLAILPANAELSESYQKGALLVGYRYIVSTMKDYRVGTDEISLEEVLEQFPVAPKEMSVDINLLEMRYVPINNLALLAVIPHLGQTTHHQTRSGSEFNISTAGLSDISLIASSSLHHRPTRQAVLDVGLSLPTGSILETGDTPRGTDTRLPYTMQLGSGTFDLITCVKLLARASYWHYGIKVQSKLRLGNNNEHYRLGNRLLVSAWLSPKRPSWITPLVNINLVNWGRIKGADPLLDPSVVAVANPDMHGGLRIDSIVRLSAAIPYRFLENHQIAIEFGLPLLHSLNGPQLETQKRWGLVWEFRSRIE